MLSSIRSHSRLLAVGVSCAALGAGGSAIASAGASTGQSAHHAKSAATRTAKHHGLRGLARRAVHGDAVVHTRTGFATVTFDRGVVDSVNGQQLKLTEGTKRATYRTVTLNIPSTARVRDNHQRSTMSAVKPGQRAIVVQAPHRTVVVARTPKAG